MAEFRVKCSLCLPQSMKNKIFTEIIYWRIFSAFNNGIKVHPLNHVISICTGQAAWIPNYLHFVLALNINKQDIDDTLNDPIESLMYRKHTIKLHRYFFIIIKSWNIFSFNYSFKMFISVMFHGKKCSFSWKLLDDAWPLINFTMFISCITMLGQFRWKMSGYIYFCLLIKKGCLHSHRPNTNIFSQLEKEAIKREWKNDFIPKYKNSFAHDNKFYAFFKFYSHSLVYLWFHFFSYISIIHRLIIEDLQAYGRPLSSKDMIRTFLFHFYH